MDGVTKPLNVLLIEDSPEEAELIQVMLAQSRREVLHVHHVSRLADGLVRLASDPVDVVLLDFSLPDSSGLVSFERARKVAPHVPIVILTNLDDEETALRGGARGSAGLPRQAPGGQRAAAALAAVRDRPHAASSARCGRARSGTPWRSTAPTTGSGTGT